MRTRRNQHNDNIEPLFSPGEIEIRNRPDGSGEEIFGYYAVYGKRSNILTTRKGVKFVEFLEPGAFDNTDFSAVESRFNHETFLAAPPSVRHGVDQRGAWYAINYDPSDPDHVAVRRRIERGDVKGSSFEFIAPGPADQVVTDEAGIKVRSIKHIPQVFEFGPVVSPAYPSTTTFVRSLDASYEEELQRTEQEKTDFEKRRLEAEKFRQRVQLS